MKGIVMADEAELQATSNEEATADLTAESATDEQINDSQETSQESTESGDTTAEVKEDNKTAPSNQEDTGDSKPISRRSAAYRIQQLARENKTLKQQVQPATQTDEWEAPAEDDTQPDIAALIAQEVEKRLHPIVSESSKNADDGEIAELFSGDKQAEHSVLEPKIRQMWELPQYKEVAASDLYKIAKFDQLSNSMDLVRQQAVEDYKKAVREAKDSSSSGTSNTTNRTGKGGKSTADMTDEEFIAHNERIKLGLAE